MSPPSDSLLLPAERLVAFSDAVVAIAITLLVLPLVDLVPEAFERHESVEVILIDNLGSLLAFLLSFAVIARLWRTHHAVFRGVVRVTSRLVWLDMIWLLTIVLLPFPTALAGTRTSDPLTAVLYVGVLAVNMMAMAVMALWIQQDPSRQHCHETRPLALEAMVPAGLVTAGLVIVLVVPRASFSVLLLLLLAPALSRGLARVVYPTGP